MFITPKGQQYLISRRGQPGRNVPLAELVAAMVASRPMSAQDVVSDLMEMNYPQAVASQAIAKARQSGLVTGA